MTQVIYTLYKYKHIYNPIYGPFGAELSSATQYAKWF